MYMQTYICVYVSIYCIYLIGAYILYLMFSICDSSAFIYIHLLTYNLTSLIHFHNRPLPLAPPAQPAEKARNSTNSKNSKKSKDPNKF